MLPALNGLWGDFRIAARSLCRAPLFTAITIAILSTGLGANTAIFNLVNMLFLRALPVMEPDRLVSVAPVGSTGQPRKFLYSSMDEMRRSQRVLSGLAGYGSAGIRPVEADGSLTPRAIVVVTPEFYEVMGLKPLLGRTFRPGAGEDAREAVITYRFWRTQMGGRRDVVGSVIRVEGRPYTVAAVLPESYHGFAAGSPEDVTLPVPAFYDMPWLIESAGFEMVGRLKPGQSLEQAREQLRALWPAVKQASVPAAYSASERETFFSQPLLVESAGRGSATDYIRSRFANRVLVLMAAVGVTLLIACANIAGLMLSRAASRAEDTSVRIALGAGRWRLMRQVVAESLLLVAPSVIVGGVLGAWLSRKLADFMWIGLFEHNFALDLDARVYTFLAASAFVTCLLTSAIPAWQLGRTPPSGVLYGSRGGAVAHRQRAGRVLAAVQSALALILLTATGLFCASLMSIKGTNLGFDPGRVLGLSLAGLPNAYDDPSFVPSAYYADLTDRVRRVPGVLAAGLSKDTVGGIASYDYYYRAAAAGTSRETGTFVFSIGPGFHDALGIKFLAGRDFALSDTGDQPRLAIISQTLARELFGGGDAIGRRISVSPSHQWQDLRVIGVVADANVANPRKSNSAIVYLPIFQQPARLYSLDLHVRTAGPPGAMANQMLRILRQMGREYSLLTEPLDASLDRMLVQERLMATLATFFGAFPLALACLGLYGMVSYNVSRRTAEMGVRLALGAARGALVAMVMRESLTVVLAGIACGVPLAIAGAYAARSVLFGVSPADPRLLALASAALAASAVLASLVPAIRATRINPANALRAE